MRIKIQSGLMMALWGTLLIPALVWAGTVKLPQTCQTTCWDASGAAISCAGTGQDGEIQAGAAWPNPRFTDNGNQTVTDNMTGLAWAKDGNLIKTRNPGFDADETAGDGSVNWQHALDYVKKLNEENYLGHNDWRLPNRNELNSLVDISRYNPALASGHPFNNVQSSYYWASSTGAFYTSYAWIVGMGDGVVRIGIKDYNGRYVWPVRGEQSVSLGSLIIYKTGQSTCYDAAGSVITCTGTSQDGEIQAGAVWPNPRFTDNGNQTVTDNMTGLFWSKDANAAGATKTWQEALDYIKTLNSNNYLGHNDWRLPNRNELASLMDISRYNPALTSGHPFANVQSDHYWSSSTNANYTNSAWIADIITGYVGSNDKTSNYYMWPVRGGQSGSLGSSVLYASFTNVGIWKYSGSGTECTQVTASNPQLLVTMGSTLYGTFAGLGIWKFDGTNWNQTTTSVPEMIVGSSSTLYGSFAGLGIWQWNGTQWSQTTTSIPQTIIASTSDLYGTFSGLGIWKFDGTNWNQLTTSIPDMLVTSGTKLYGTFANMGIWLWDGTEWKIATSSNPQLIAASRAKLYGSFAGAGIWEWDGAATWTQISPNTPTQMVASGAELYAVFTGLGIKKWDGTSWSLISGNEPAGMVVGE